MTALIGRFWSYTNPTMPSLTPYYLRINESYLVWEDLLFGPESKSFESKDISFYLSGGSANESQHTSLGGAISLKRITSQVFTPLSLITGVEIVEGFGNLPGLSYLKWESEKEVLSWKAGGLSTFKGQIVRRDGVYVLGDEQGYLIVEVVIKNLPLTSATEEVLVGDDFNKIIDNLSPLNSVYGRTSYRCLFLKNEGSFSLLKARLWLRVLDGGPTSVSVALDPVGKNGVALGPLVDDKDTQGLLNSLVFSKPLVARFGLGLGTLSPGDFYPLWIKRELAPGNLGQTSSDKLSIAVTGVRTDG